MKPRHINLIIVILYLVLSAIQISDVYNSRHGFSSDEQWIKTIDEASGIGIRQTADGNYMLIGKQSDSQIAVILNLDERGEYIWGLRFDDIEFTFIQHTNDGNYIICGIYDNSILILKIDQSGDIIWTRKSDITGHPYSIQQFDDTYLVVGYMATRSFVMRLDDQGTSIWTRTYAFNEFYSIQQTTTGFMIIGNDWSETRDYMNSVSYSTSVAIISIDNDGIPIWYNRIYAGISYPLERFVLRTDENEFVLVVRPNENSGRMTLLKIDINGTQLWAKSYPGHIDFNHIQQTSDGGFIIVGNDYDLETLSRIFIMKTDDHGNVNWTNAYGGTSELTYNSLYFDVSKFVQETDDGYIVIGNRYYDEDKMIILKLDSLGDVDIHGKETLNHHSVNVEIDMYEPRSITSISINAVFTELDAEISSNWTPSIRGNIYSLVSFEGYLNKWFMIIGAIGVGVCIILCCIGNWTNSSYTSTTRKFGGGGHVEGGSGLPPGMGKYVPPTKYPELPKFGMISRTMPYMPPPVSFSGFRL
jgi:hypothetical protein